MPGLGGFTPAALPGLGVTVQCLGEVQSGNSNLSHPEISPGRETPGKVWVGGDLGAPLVPGGLEQPGTVQDGMRWL